MLHSHTLTLLSQILYIKPYCYLGLFVNRLAFSRMDRFLVGPEEVLIN